MSIYYYYYYCNIQQAALTPSSSSVSSSARERRLEATRRRVGVSPADIGYEWACWKRAVLEPPYPENFNPRPTREDERDFASHVYPIVRELTNAGGAPLTPVMVVEALPRHGSGSMRVHFDAHAEPRRLVRVEADNDEF